MKLIVWNSQGGKSWHFDKWDSLWTNFISPYIGNEDIFGFLAEAGIAPWFKGNYKENGCYNCSEESLTYDKTAAASSTFCQAMNPPKRTLKRYAYWVPWVYDMKSASPNARCSLAGVMVPAPGTASSQTTSHQLDILSADKRFIRPIIRTILSKGDSVFMTIFMVHFVSGSNKKATDELETLISGVSDQIPSKSPAIIVGDMNIDITGAVPPLPGKWRVVNTGVPTHNKGKELDFGVLYDPNGQFGHVVAKVEEPFGTAKNPSDHSVIRYEF